MTACSPLLNLAYFTNLTAEINAIGAIGATGSAADKLAALTKLQTITNSIFNDLSTLNSTLASQLTLMGLITPLLTAPSGNFTSILTWIGNVITFLQQVYLPFVNLTTELTQLTAAVTSLTSVITAAASALGGTVTIPTLSIICTLEGA